MAPSVSKISSSQAKSLPNMSTADRISAILAKKNMARQLRNACTRNTLESYIQHFAICVHCMLSCRLHKKQMSAMSYLLVVLTVLELASRQQ